MPVRIEAAYHLCFNRSPMRKEIPKTIDVMEKTVIHQNRLFKSSTGFNVNSKDEIFPKARKRKEKNAQAAGRASTVESAANSRLRPLRPFKGRR